MARGPQQTGSSTDSVISENEAFLATLEPELREEILRTADDTFIALLSPKTQMEVTALRALQSLPALPPPIDSAPAPPVESILVETVDSIPKEESPCVEPVEAMMALDYHCHRHDLSPLTAVDSIPSPIDSSSSVAAEAETEAEAEAEPRSEIVGQGEATTAEAQQLDAESEDAEEQRGEEATPDPPPLPPPPPPLTSSPAAAPTAPTPTPPATPPVERISVRTLDGREIFMPPVPIRRKPATEGLSMRPPSPVNAILQGANDIAQSTQGIMPEATCLPKETAPYPGPLLANVLLPATLSGKECEDAFVSGAFIGLTEGSPTNSEDQDPSHDNNEREHEGRAQEYFIMVAAPMPQTKQELAAQAREEAQAAVEAVGRGARRNTVSELLWGARTATPSSPSVPGSPALAPAAAGAAGAAGAGAAATAAAEAEMEGRVLRRDLLPYHVSCDPRTGDWNVTLSLRQPNLGPKDYTPQGSRVSSWTFGRFDSRVRAVRTAELAAPPVWHPKKLPKNGGGSRVNGSCRVCKFSFAPLRPPKHCRSCGFLVCGKCSIKHSASVLPPSYFFNETKVRMCFACQCLQERFVSALWAGDAETAHSLFSTGNLNLHCPLTWTVSQEYPVHAAARGGNLNLLRWLLELQYCALYNGSKPITTSAGLSVLGVAAFWGHAEMMVYLTQFHNCRVDEIENANVALRGLHAALYAPGPMPHSAEGPPLSGEGADSVHDDPDFDIRPQQAMLATGHPVIRHRTFPEARAALGRLYDASLYRVNSSGVLELPDDRRSRPLVFGLGQVGIDLLTNLPATRAKAARLKAASLGLTSQSSLEAAGLGQAWAAAEAEVENTLIRLALSGTGADAAAEAEARLSDTAVAPSKRVRSLEPAYFGWPLPYSSDEIISFPISYDLFALSPVG